MGLKADRNINKENVSCVTPAGVAIPKGSVLISAPSQPSGRGVGQGINDGAPQAVVAPAGGPPSGARVLGILENDVVVVDLTRYVRNFQKVEQLAGEPVAMISDGWVYTDMFTGTPVANTPAYVGGYSKWQSTPVNAVPAAGTFDTAPGADGYVRVSILVA